VARETASIAEDVPATHAVQLDAPTSSWYWPAGQLVQAAALGPENSPTAHVLHITLPPSENVPAAQLSHAVASDLGW
jgi:hypothetical protein